MSNLHEYKSNYNKLYTRTSLKYSSQCFIDTGRYGMATKMHGTEPTCMTTFLPINLHPIHVTARSV